MFKVGSVRKVEVRNFVTYNYAVMHTGPNLNIVLGPNGTGKSTIVAAIILGLGGNPRTVGRGTKVSEYVKHNCDEAQINIFLQDEQEDKYVKITRNFDRHDKTNWCLNNERVSFREIVDCIKNFNIQVDNLCQFLPQDRVAEFAKMDQQQLLKETQRALCRDDLIQKQQALVETRTRHKGLISAIDKNSTRLTETQEANARLESKVENFNKRKEFLVKIADIDRKFVWLQYDSLYEKVGETKNDLKSATKVYDKYKNEIQPTEDEIKKVKAKITKLQDTGSTLNRSLRQSQSGIQRQHDLFEQSKSSIRTIKDTMTQQLNELEVKERTMELTSTKIAEMKRTEQQLYDQFGNDEQVKERINKTTSNLQKCRQQISAIQSRKDEVAQERNNVGARIRACEHEMARLENVRQQRLDILKGTDRDAYEAVLWLRNNKHLFKGEIFEPIIMELNVLDGKDAKYLENIIANRDRVAFTCVDVDDMNALIQHLRHDKRLKVNILHSGRDGKQGADFQPTIPIEQLKQFGLYAYVKSLFTAPDPIMKYLCENYGVHNIPVGNAETNRCYNNIPSSIRVFFSDTQRYSVKISRYSGEKSIAQNGIYAGGRSFSCSVDILRLDKLRAQIQALRQNYTSFDGQLGAFDKEIDSLNAALSEIGDDLKKYQRVKSQMQAIADRIKAMENSLLEQRPTDEQKEKIRKNARGKIERIVLEMGKLHVDLQGFCKSMLLLNAKIALNSDKLEKSRVEVSNLENKIRETRTKMEEAEVTLNQVREAFSEIRAQAKAALQKAKSISNNFTPDDPGFAMFRPRFDELPEDPEQLLRDKNKLETKMECLNTADEGEMQEYEARLASIEELQNNIERGQVELSRVTNRMEKLRKEWLEPLVQFVDEINLKFGEYFDRMGCAGEVSLNKGEDELDFEKYGLLIKVTYRNGEPLQELNSTVQSGGERAVATAVFMLSIQTLTPVPFRCVDEINQGMDEENERRIFHLIVESTDIPNTAQYFLITPKLIKKLQYSRTVKVHFVHNGPFLEQDRKWPMSKMSNREKYSIH